MVENMDWNTPKEQFKFIFKSSWKFLFCIIVPLLLLVVFLWSPARDPDEIKDKCSGLNGCTFSDKKYNKARTKITETFTGCTNATSGWTNETCQKITTKPSILPEKAPHGLYVVLVTCIFWVAECLPMPITSLIPAVLVPLMGIADSDLICGQYFSHTFIFLFTGCIIALSFEYSNLHNRIAFFVMKSMGAQPSVLLFGMMAVSMTLSCWMNNTSTTAMMVPVISSILDQYKNKLIPQETPEELAALYGIPDNEDSLEPSVQKLHEDEAKPDLAEEENVVAEQDKNADTEDMDLGEKVKKENPSSLHVLYSGTTRTTVTTTDQMESSIQHWSTVIESKKSYVRNVEIMFLLGVAAASNIGGTGIITGTGTNLIASSSLSAYASSVRDGKNAVKDKISCTNPSKQYWELDFMRWAFINFIPMLANTLIAWMFLSCYFQGAPTRFKIIWKKMLKKRVSPLEQKRADEMKIAQDNIRHVIKQKYLELGRVTLHEAFILIIFVFMVFLWMLQNPLFLRGKPLMYDPKTDKLFKDDITTFKLIHPKCAKQADNKMNATLKLGSEWGWDRYFGDKCDEAYIHPYVPTLFVCLLLFIIPKDPKYYKSIASGGLADGFDDPLLPFDYALEQLPWGPMLMLGGGFAVSKTISESQLSAVMQKMLKESSTLKAMDVNTVMGLVLVGVSIVTSIASNTATAVIISPVLLGLASTKGVPPLYLLVPPIVSASYAFCLPISTPPNAIVFDKSQMKQKDMFVPGLFLTIICNSILYIFIITWMKWMLGVADYDHSCDLKDDNLSGTAGTRTLILELPDSTF